jgi:isopenicillin N synthase-like dioxygenase
MAMTDPAFPIFDLASWEAAPAGERRALAAEVDAICRATGFLAIAGHGVPQGIIDAAWNRAEAFFDLPPEQKARASAPYPGYPYGYLGPRLESLA